MSWDRFGNFSTLKNVLLSGANSQNQRALEATRCCLSQYFSARQYMYVTITNRFQQTSNHGKNADIFGCDTASLVCNVLGPTTPLVFEPGLITHSQATALIDSTKEKMAVISQTTFSKAFSRMKMFVSRLKFHRSLFVRVQLTTSQHWFRKWLGTPLHICGP